MAKINEVSLTLILGKNKIEEKILNSLQLRRVNIIKVETQSKMQDVTKEAIENLKPNIYISLTSFYDAEKKYLEKIHKEDNNTFVVNFTTKNSNNNEDLLNQLKETLKENKDECDMIVGCKTTEQNKEITSLHILDKNDNQSSILDSERIDCADFAVSTIRNAYYRKLSSINS